MREIIFLEPVFKEMIWGGSKLKTDFGYDIPGEHTGECWAIAAHKNGDSRVAGGEFSGYTLSRLWAEHRELFGGMAGDVYPLLIKIIDATDSLSIQVHPDDEYAMKNENGSLGKTECWYILDCDEGADIIIGHNAKSKEELKSMVADGRWDDLLRKIPIKKGDFFQIDPGCLHAIRKGTVILETQQNSDITYRVYDYDRLSDGKPRELHTQKALDVITAPAKEATVDIKTEKCDGFIREKLYDCEYYTVERIVVETKAKINQPYSFMNVSVVEGAGTVDGHEIKKGSHFILPCGYGEVEFVGNMELIVSYMR